MHLLKRLLLWLIIVLIVVFCGATVYIRAHGKSLVEQALSRSMNRNVVLGSAFYRFPFGFWAKNIHISKSLEGGTFLDAEGVVLQLSSEAIYQRKLIFDAVIVMKPTIIIEAAKPSDDGLIDEARRYGVVVPPIMREETSGAIDSSSVKDAITESNRPAEVTIKQLVVRHGELQYINGLTEQGFSFNLEDVQLKAGPLIFPVRPGRSKFNLSARLVKEKNPLSGSQVKGSGWVDAARKDVDAEIEVIEVDGTVGLMADMVAQNNDVKVSGEIKMKNFLKDAAKKISSENSTINDFVLNALSSAGVEIGLKFSFKTKMDRFRIEKVNFSGNVVTK